MGNKSNNDRSNSMNPNNSAYIASIENRSDQLNPNNSEYKDDDSQMAMVLANYGLLI